MSAYLLTNPLSGSSSPERLTTILRHLHEAGVSPRLLSVSCPADVHRCCQEIYSIDTQPLIIIAAGDGTINLVLNSIPPGTAQLAILPMGTSNVLAAELGITSLEAGLRRLQSGTNRSLAVGEVTCGDRLLRFALMAGIGFDGAVVRDVRSAEKRLLKQGAYLLSAIRNCVTWNREMLQVVCNNRTLTCHTAVVCNGARYGGNYLLAPGADICSAGFTVVCVTANNRRAYLRLALELFRGASPPSTMLQRLETDQLTVLGNGPIQLDGDYVGTAPARFRSLAGFAQLIA